MSRYVSKQNQAEQQVQKFHLQVIRKNIASVKAIDKIAWFGIKLIYNYITQEWGRTDCQGPVYLIKCTNGSMKLIILNQLGKKNYIQDIRDHISFEFKQTHDQGQTNYYLNLKITDSVVSTVLLSIWSTDPKLKEIYDSIMHFTK